MELFRNRRSGYQTATPVRHRARTAQVCASCRHWAVAVIAAGAVAAATSPAAAQTVRSQARTLSSARAPDETTVLQPDHSSADSDVALAAVRAAEASPQQWMSADHLKRLRSISDHLEAGRQEMALEEWGTFVKMAYRQNHLRSAEEAAPAFDLVLRRAYLEVDAQVKPLADRVRRAEERLSAASRRARALESGGTSAEASDLRPDRLELEAAELEVDAAGLQYDAAVIRLQEAVQAESRRYQTLSNVSKASHDIAMNAIRNVRA
jgi:hypothetical protein